MNVHFINIFFFQIYIILIATLYDLYLFYTNKIPGSWDEFYENKKMFTGYSAIYYSKKKYVSFIIFFLLVKILISLQIIISIDLFGLKMFTNKIKIIDNLLYKVLICIPWVYVSLFGDKIKSAKIGKKEIKIVLMNYIFLNLGFTSKFSVNNTLIFIKSGENWKKHSGYYGLKLGKFLKLTQKYYFNETLEKNHNYFN